MYLSPRKVCFRKNENIAKGLKNQRKLHNMSVKEVSRELEKRSIFVAEKTIYGWESGQSQPDADTFLILCDIYNIVNILEEFGYTKKTILLLKKVNKK